MKRLCIVVLLAGVIQPVFAEESAPKHTHMSWEERFNQANVTHDGHLTLDQAKTGYKTVARHFRDIDTEGKGFVTENDIRAWHALQKAARHGQGAEDPLRPRPAFSRYSPDQQRGVPDANQTMLTPQPAQIPAQIPAMIPAMVNLDHPVQAH